MRKILLFFCMLLLPVWAQEEITQVSYFADQFGDQASFWKLVVKGKTYVAFKVKSPDKTGEANVIMDKALLDEFEQKVAELKATPNPLTADGFKVLWSKESGESKVRTLLGRWHGIRVKMVQVEENKGGKLEHQITMDKCYNDFTRAVKKARAIW